MYDPNRVNLNESEHAAAKELNELFEALAYGEGDKAKEALEAVLAVASGVGSANDYKVFLIKVLLANVSDEIQERLLTAKPLE